MLDQNLEPVAMVNVAYCFDEKYQQHVAASLMSVISNFGGRTSRLSFHLLTEGATVDMIEYARRIEVVYGCCVTLYEIGDHKQALVACVDTVDMDLRYWSMAAFFRLMLPDILPDAIEKILYLDADTIAVGDIQPLFELQLDGFAAAGVPDPKEEAGRALIGTSEYYNSGVLMMNLPVWRHQCVADKCMGYLSQQDTVKSFIDQDAINVVLEHQILRLPARWNDQVTHGYEVASSSVLNLRKNISILHYITRHKPWQAWYRNPLGENYWTYLRASPWKTPMVQQPLKVAEFREMAIKHTKDGKLQDAITCYEALLEHFLKPK